MKLFKNQITYLMDLVMRELKTEQALPVEFRNFKWETNLKEIISTLEENIQ